MYKLFLILFITFSFLKGNEVIVCQINPYGGGIKNGDIEIQCKTDLINDTTLKKMYSDNWKLISTSGVYLFFQKNK